MNEQIRIGRLLQAALAAFLLCGLQVLEAQGQSAQVDSTTNRFWVDFGAGGGTYEQRWATAFSANYQRNKHLFILRSGSNSEILSERSLVDTALLYGRALGLPPVWVSKQHIWHVSAGAGIGIVWRDADRRVTVGLPLQAQFSFHPVGGIGIGITAFYNLNMKQSFGGLTIGWQIGSMP
jgi:hypothetical protein